MEQLDYRGKPCPLPVAGTRKFLMQNPDKSVTVLVSKPNQCENVAALAERFGRKVETEERGDHFAVIFR